MAMAKKQEQYTLTTRIIIGFGILMSLFFVAVIVAALYADDASTGNVAIIKIHGTIVSSGSSGVFGDAVVTSDDIAQYLQDARETTGVRAIILDINSPGGSAVGSDEIARAVKDTSATGVPVVAWIREIGASGGYWIASSSDHIVANRMSITGSIGVISSYFEFAEFLDDWNITYNRLVSGDRKDVGDPFQELSYQDRQFLQEKMDKIHDIFIEEVATNRNLSLNTTRELADGRFFLGIEAYEAQLIDELGGQQEVYAYIEQLIGEPVDAYIIEEDEGLLATLLGVKQRTGLNIPTSPLPMAR